MSSLEKLMEQIKEKRGVRDSTIKVYKRYLGKLAKEITGEEFKNADFLLKNKKKIYDFLKDKSESVKKNYLASILVAMSPNEKRAPQEKFKEVYNFFKNNLLDEHNKYNDRMSSHTKSEKEEKNWMEWTEIMKYQRKLGNSIKKLGYKQSSKELKNKKDLDLIQQYLILSLYVLHPPKRLEYANVQIINYSDFQDLSEQEKDDNIYLVKLSRNKKFFSFGKNAVKSETKQNIRKPVDRQLNSVLNLWLNFNESKYLLINSNKNKMTKNGLSKYLRKIFKPFNKNISASMLRKIFLSHHYDPAYEAKKKKHAEEMNHSTKVQQEVYVKK